jgi:hypothetical protein
MVHCLLCGTLNNDDFERCVLCKTEPERALRVVTESQRWVNVTLVAIVFLALAGSVALNLYLGYRVFFQSEMAAVQNSSDSSEAAVPLNGAGNRATAPSAPTATSLASGQRITGLIGDCFLISFWLVVSIAFVGGVMYGAKKGTMLVCTEITRGILRRKVARNEYEYPGVGLAHVARSARGQANVRGTL